MKNMVKYIFFTVTIVFGISAQAQLSITGPTCVLAGTVYQYGISNAGTSAMRVCVTGGTIVDKDKEKVGECVESEAPLANVLVIWNDTTQGKLSITTSSASGDLSVNLTAILQPGFLDSSTSRQSLTDTLTVPATIICSPASGGSCSPGYSYQWQQSDDSMIWANVDGSTGENLSFIQAVGRTTYYRRKITETVSGTIAYSSVASIYVSIPIGSN